jgi:RNA polymerase sigma factor (sigma-70 family)
MARTTNAVPLHDVRDAVALVKSIVARSSIPAHARDDAIGHLLVEIVDLAGRYDPARGISFSNYASQTLPLRLVDYVRRELGDSRYAARREHVPLDEADLDSLADPYDYVEQITEAAAISSDLAGLSPRGRRIVEEVAVPVASGESYDSVAQRLGIRRNEVARRLEEVRNELLGQALGLGDGASTDEIVEALHTRTEDA